MTDTVGELGGTAKQAVVLRRKAKTTHGGGRAVINGVVRLNRPKSEYISPCKLITERHTLL